MNARDIGNATLVGIAGATALFGVHQLARVLTDHAPRVDVVGRRAVEKALNAAGVSRPDERALYWITFASAIATDSTYYGLVAAGRWGNRTVRGALMGLAAGIASLILPPRLGLGEPPRADRLPTQIMTVAWYVIGGLAAAAAATALDRRYHRVDFADVAV